jgi:outer membrane murein-binding lipoprotein Lpp
MDKLGSKVETLSGDVREMKTDIRTLREHADKTDERIERLEHKD